MEPIKVVQRQVSRHRLPAFIFLVIVVAIVLVSISMKIYYTSDAFRLDLSRPEYKDLRPQIARDSKRDDAFQAQGKINESVLDDFLKQYNEEAKKITDSRAFEVDVLSDEQLGI